MDVPGFFGQRLREKPARLRHEPGSRQRGSKKPAQALDPGGFSKEPSRHPVGVRPRGSSPQDSDGDRSPDRRGEIAVAVQADRFFQRLTIGFLRFYQSWKWTGLVPQTCRFTPSCSQYAIDAIQKHGLLRGIRLGAARIVRCRPGVPGGEDNL